jgi:transposase
VDGWPEEMRACDVGFLPIIAAYVKRLGIVDLVNRLCPSSSEVNTGQMVLALILDSLSGRRPLYRLAERFQQMDTELLFGEYVDPSKFNDDAAGRTLDALYDSGTGQIFTAVAVKMVEQFRIDTRCVHHDTTSVTLYGDYDLYEDPDHGQPFMITNGYNKDHRPDLKQLVHSLLCVDQGIPIGSKLINGNESDKVVNRDVLADISEKMRSLGRIDFVYIADSALVTQDNLDLIGDEQKGCFFITRLPKTYKECGNAITRAMIQDRWKDLGTVSQQPPTVQHTPAHYHGFETGVTLYAKRYRALVVYSDALDKKSVKKLEKDLKQDESEMLKLKAHHEKISYACLPDAEAALGRLAVGKFHRLVGKVQEIARYGRGRPKADGTRTVKRMDYRLNLRLDPDEEAISRARREAGCFVLLSNVPLDGPDMMDSYELLSQYKGQDMVERNFAFLKDDAIVNSLFLKTPARIEALGLILVLSLMVWRLMQRTMRISLSRSGSTIEGWDKKPTSRPTSFMMATKFPTVLVAQANTGRILLSRLSHTQRSYLKILGLSSNVFLDPKARITNGPFQVLKSWESTG